MDKIGNVTSSRLRHVVGVFLSTRLALYLLGFAAFAIFNNRLLPLAGNFIEQWWRWDSVHFINIAEHGYTGVGEERFNIVFFPLYPILIAALANFALHPVVAGLLVSNAAAIFAVIFLYRLVRIDFDDATAQRAAWYFYLFPTAYFLSAAYTESLFLALAIASFYLARKQRWFPAGILGMLASLTRNTGLIVFVALVIEYLHQKNLQPRTSTQGVGVRGQWQKIGADVAALLLVPVGFGWYLWINFVVYGNWFAFLEIQREHWYKFLTWPWHGLIGAWQGFFWRDPAEVVMVSFMEIAFAVIGLVATFFAFRLRLSYGVYTALGWLLMTSTNFWLSVPRYTLSLFPIFILLGLWGRRSTANYYLIPVSVLLLGLFTTQFVLGRWAF